MEKKLIQILESEVTIDEQVVTDRTDEWSCHTGQMHPADIVKLKFQIIVLFCQGTGKRQDPDREKLEEAIDSIVKRLPIGFDTQTQAVVAIADQIIALFGDVRKQE